MSRPLKQLTILGFDRALERHIRELARRERISLNQAVLRLLHQAAGIEGSSENPRTVGSSLDDLIGTWSEDEAREFQLAIADLDSVDEDMWR